MCVCECVCVYACMCMCVHCAHIQCPSLVDGFIPLFDLPARQAHNTCLLETILWNAFVVVECISRYPALNLY